VAEREPRNERNGRGWFDYTTLLPSSHSCRPGDAMVHQHAQESLRRRRGRRRRRRGPSRRNSGREVREPWGLSIDCRGPGSSYRSTPLHLSPSLIPTVNGNMVRSFSTHGHQSAAKGSLTTVSCSDIRLIQHLDSSGHGLVRRWRLIGYFPTLPPGGAVFQR
jgi:hypothetical protein